MTQRRKRNLIRTGVAATGLAITALSILAATSGGGGGDAQRAASSASTAAVTAATHAASAASLVRSGRALSTAEYRKQAAAICDELSFPTTQMSLQQAAPVIARNAAEASSTLARLRALRPPRALTSQVNDALEIVQQIVEVGGQLAVAAQANDQSGATTDYEQIQGLASAEQGIWEQIGVPQC